MRKILFMIVLFFSTSVSSEEFLLTEKYREPNIKLDKVEIIIESNNLSVIGLLDSGWEVLNIHTYPGTEQIYTLINTGEISTGINLLDDAIAKAKKQSGISTHSLALCEFSKLGTDKCRLFFLQDKDKWQSNNN